MGSIQSLRSWALATRANEDTDLQTSGFLGGVNKSLGSQVVGLIDQLQGVIAERTKTYNQLVSSINRTIDGKDGVGAKAMLAGFAGIKMISKIAGIIKKPATFGVLAAIDLVGSAVANMLGNAATKATILSAIYDYEKMMSQLGYLESTTDYTGITNPTTDPGAPVINVTSVNLNTGASKFLDFRDALMPKFNRYDPVPGGALTDYQIYNIPPNKGSVGSLRRSK